MPIRRFFSWLLFVIPALIISYYVLFPHLWHCQWIGYSDFRKVKSNFYTSPTTPPKYLQKATQSIEEARKRIAELWGKPVGDATIILCESTEQYHRYCNSDEGAGCSIGTPWGASFIVLNLDGLNTDVIAHEMCHDELFTRLGWWKTTREIPQWFNEGLALMVDYRFVATSDSVQRYLDYKDECSYVSNGGQTVLNLNEISSLHGFFSGTESHVMLAYMTSGMEISRWLANTGAQNVPRLIERIKSGETFDSAYHTFDKRNSTDK
jgi:hypothetical protein